MGRNNREKGEITGKQASKHQVSIEAVHQVVEFLPLLVCCHRLGRWNRPDLYHEPITAAPEVRDLYLGVGEGGYRRRGSKQSDLWQAPPWATDTQCEGLLGLHASYSWSKSRNHSKRALRSSACYTTQTEKTRPAAP